MTTSSFEKAWYEDRLEEYRSRQFDRKLTFAEDVYELSLKSDGSRQQRRGIQISDETSGVKIWRNVAFLECTFNARNSARFENCSFAASRIFSEGLAFDNCALVASEIHARLIVCTSTEMDMSSVHYGGPATLQFTDVKLRFCTINPDLQDSELSDIRLNASSIRSRSWMNTKLNHVDLTYSSCSPDMTFDRCQFIKITADRELLESLGAKRGGITDVELRNNFSVHDSIGELRQLFGGVLFYFHVVTMIVFLTPYVTFVAGKWLQHLWWLLHPGTSVVTEPILASLLRYIVNGGANLSQWSPDWVSMARLTIFLIYNIFRVRALIEVKRIEHSRLITGIWPKFGLNDYVWPFKSVKLTWRVLMHLVKAFAIIVVVLGCWHAVSFLMLPVPR